MRGKDDNKKRSFVFYHEWAELLANQPGKVRLAVFDAIISYSRTGELPKLPPVADMAFKFIKADMDRNTEKYEKKSAAGKNGMRKRWSKDNGRVTSDNKNNNVIDVITSDNKNNNVIDVITSDNKNNNVIDVITSDNKNNNNDNDDDNENDNENENENENENDDGSTRINTSERAKYNGARTHAKVDKDRKLEEVIAKQQQEDEKARRFQLTLYQNDDARVTKTEIPTEGQVLEYMCTSTNGSLANARDEARKFMNHYNANGWMMGTAPVRSWEAAVENWIDNIKNYGNRQQQSNEEGRRNFIAAIRNVEERARYEHEHGEEELPF